MTQVPNRILYLTCEPWETLIAVSVSKLMHQQRAQVDLHMAISDTYSVNYADALIKDIQKNPQTIGVSTLKSEYISWQKSNEPQPDYHFLAEWTS